MELELIEGKPADSFKDSNDRPPILFLHGAWHGAWCWTTNFMPFFSAHGFKTYAMSLRGHGNSDKSAHINSHSIGDYVDDLHHIVEQLDEPPIIVAHSMGGFILQRYLEKYSCAGAVLLTSVPPKGVLHISLRLIFTKSYVLPSLLRFDLYGVVNTVAKIKWAFFSDHVDSEILRSPTDHIGSESFKAFINMLLPRIRINHHTKIPMFVIGAEYDRIISKEDNEYTAAKYGAPLKIIPNIAHDAMLDENHEVVAQEILHWIKKAI